MSKERQRKNPILEFRGDEMSVSYKYARVQTPGEEAELKRYYQWRFSKGVSQKIPIEEINVKPKAGERFTAQIHFRVRLRESLYIGLWQVHQENNKALTRLIDRLKEYRTWIQVNEAQVELINWAIENLDEIVHPKKSIPQNIQSYLDWKREMATRTDWPEIIEAERQ